MRERHPLVANKGGENTAFFQVLLLSILEWRCHVWLSMLLRYAEFYSLTDMLLWAQESKGCFRDLSSDISSAGDISQKSAAQAMAGMGTVTARAALREANLPEIGSMEVPSSCSQFWLSVGVGVVIKKLRMVKGENVNASYCLKCSVMLQRLSVLLQMLDNTGEVILRAPSVTWRYWYPSAN